MATYQIITWKDVPSMIEARDAAGTVTRPLSDRFQQLIDSVAMQLGLQDQDAYLDLWARGDVQERPGSATEVAEAVAAEIEARFPEIISRAFRRP
jgi:Virulence factor